ncbi:BppU family phage baseplate upper protein [Bacillus sp. GC_Bacil_1]|uniref:BppU family phage baseplate upper protein n=1 Tax=Bacillus sp. GC_Bacil_1 TaxID=2937370 RepID=UPI00226B88CC|nr:BppU family phage baseplate upper protein [Bacillus sp. GC_Bacil_1]
MKTKLILDINKTQHAQLNSIVTGRVGDKSSNTVDVYVVDGFIPYNLTGSDVYFECSKPDNTSVRDKNGIVMIDAAKGHFEYTFPAQTFASVGKSKQAYFTVEKNSTVKATTQDFVIVSLPDALTNRIPSKTYISQLEELIWQLEQMQLDVLNSEAYREAHDAKEFAEQANELSINIQKQLNEIVINGDSSVEAAQARIDTEGTAHETLKSRLDEEFQKNATQIQILNNLQISVDQFPVTYPEKTDRPRFQRTFDYAKNNGIGTVKIPKNDYVFDGVPVVLYDNMIVESNGAMITMLGGTYPNGIGFFTTRVDNSGNPRISLDYDASVPIKKNISFRGKMILDGNMDKVICTNSTSTCSGIIAYRINNFRAEGLIIRNLPGNIGGGYGIAVAYSETAYLKEITIDRTDRQNICIWETLDAHIDNVNLNYSHLRECILVSNNLPMSLQSSYCTVSNSKLKNLSSTGVHVIRFSGAGSGIIEKCEIEGSNAVDGIYVTDTLYKFVRALNNKIKNCLYGVRVESDIDKYIIVENNELESCVNGIRHVGVGGTAIYSKNKIKGSTSNPFYVSYCDYQTITDNEFDGGTQVFIRPNIKSHVISNKVRNMSDASYALLVGGDTTSSVSYMLNSLKNNTANSARILTSGKALGNEGSIVTSTCQTDQTLTSIAATPLFIGQIAVVGGIGYIATGTALVSDWKRITT